MSAWIAGTRLRPLIEVLDIAIQFAWGLHAAHVCGLVHQDVKPANVLLTSDGIAKVSDFGLSRVTSISGSDAPLVASTGMTLAYASPEQANGARLSRHTDIWSWGVSLLEMLVGEVSWHSGVAVADSLESILEESDPDRELRERLTPEIVGVLRRCFEQVPHERWNSLHEAANTLIRIYEQAGGGAYPRLVPIVEPRKEQRPREDAWDVKQLVRDVFAAAGAKADICASNTAGSSEAMAVENIRLMELAIKSLDSVSGRDHEEWLLLRTDCLRAKASFHFDENDIHGCDVCLGEAVSDLVADPALRTSEKLLWNLASTHLDRSRYLHDANVAERAIAPAREAIGLV